MIQQSYKPRDEIRSESIEEYTMKYHIRSLTITFAALSLLLLSSCVHNNAQTEEAPPTTADLVAKAAADPTPPAPAQLPVRYQNPGFVTVADDQVDESLDKEDEEYAIKVGANIRSTQGPQPLWDILKRMGMLKGMSVSWSSDVDQNVPVDVDIKANDNYYDAIDNLLRQVDYFHEVEGSTIIVKYKETKRFHVAMPFTHQVFETATGGNVLGGKDDTANIEGTIRLDSRQNEFDIWANIKLNLDTILEIWSGRRQDEQMTLKESQFVDSVDEEAAKASKTYKGSTEQEGGGVEGTASTAESRGSRERTAQGYYTIDKPVGIISVTAPRSVMEKVDDYFEALTKELYKQVTIEAKIIEVQLEDSSTLGIDWNLLLRSMSFGGTMGLGKSYDKGTTDTNNRNNRTDSTTRDQYDSSSTYSNTDGTTNSSSRTRFNLIDSFSGAATTAATVLTGGASNAAAGVLSLDSFNFADFLHALSEQGKTSILANPKLSVMNGQPALISVGRNVTYIESIESSTEGVGTASRISYTVETDKILSGVGLALTPVIKNDDEIIMTLVPVTSLLEEPIEYRSFGGDAGGQVGLPIVNVREMSSMVQVRDGEILVIGGLITTVETTEGENLFPGLANVPILKYLTGFETKVMRKRELIILLRPRII